MQYETNLLERIVIDPELMAGKPVVRGTRLSVQFILNLLAHDQTPDMILAEYPYLTQADLKACMLFANRVLDSTDFMPLAKAA
jgi:uncharacterized protein (DUF433 family)